MLGFELLIPLALAQAAERPAELRSLSVAVTRGNGEAVASLGPEEVVVIENGVAREVTRVELDTRPLDVAVLVDTSAAAGSAYRLHVVDPVLKLLRALPKGSRYTLWATGDRPQRLLELTEDAGEAASQLKRIPTQGGNTVLDAIVEASEYLKKKEGGRRALVAISAVGTEFSARDRYQVVERAQRNLDLFAGVLFENDDAAGEAPEPRFTYDFVFGQLAKAGGGLFERPLSPLGIARSLSLVERDLNSRLLVRYATLPEIAERKLEVRVARPDVKVRAPSRSASEGSGAQ